MRLIDADKLDCRTLPKKLYPHLQAILDFIDSQTTVDVVERSEYESLLKQLNHWQSEHAKRVLENCKLHSKINEIIEEIKDESYLSYDDNPRRILDEDCVIEIIQRNIEAVGHSKIDDIIFEIKAGYYGDEEMSETDSERADAFNNGLSYALEILKRNIGECNNEGTLN